MILCKYIVPLFLGYCRSIGRTNSNHFSESYDDKFKNNLFSRKFDCNLYPEAPSTELNVPAIVKQANIEFPLAHLQTIFQILKKILTKDMLKNLNDQASDVYELHKLHGCYYKKFSEVLNVVMVTLMRDLLDNQSDLPKQFTKDIQEFIIQLYLIGQTELQNKTLTVDKDLNYLNVLANSACVELLVWAVGNETGKLVVIAL